MACCTCGCCKIRHLLIKVEAGGPTKHMMACWKGLWKPVTMGIICTFIRHLIRHFGPYKAYIRPHKGAMASFTFFLPGGPQGELGTQTAVLCVLGAVNKGPQKERGQKLKSRCFGVANLFFPPCKSRPRPLTTHLFLAGQPPG